PEDWQAHLISCVFGGYDAIFCAGTGYGKSLIFEGLAALGGKNKLVMVICPLKSLELDQAKSASAKGLEAIAINKDTMRTAGLWARAQNSAQLVYLSPEMVLSDSFSKLWKDTKFRRRLTAVVIDEAHCVDEWGGDDFRPKYQKLDWLHAFTGKEIPFVACTATCQTRTFNTIWDTLGYGARPFWGVDDLDNSILYFDSKTACHKAVDTLRKCLPSHLQSAVYAFSANLSPSAKERCWNRFAEGTYRILCATDAAGMGCDVPDVKNIISFGCPNAFASVIQRWGHAGRDRTTQGTCLLLV
ncbi:P-loop containing nucleoside triphosphate hydrolase protein, partial [Gymnopus androsaceus JB14]